ncbi:MAG: hypothetical protein V1738_07015 [Patescibacteria group bacterium]
MFGATLGGLASVCSGLGSYSQLASVILGGAIGGCGVYWGKYCYDQAKKAAALAAEDRAAAQEVQGDD